MAFRADEATQQGTERAVEYLIGRCKYPSAEDRSRSKEKLFDLIDELGPVVSAYPSWHPLVGNWNSRRHPTTHPGRECGYDGLDHTTFFQNGFITCPYNDGQKVIDSVYALPSHSVATLEAERLGEKFYNEQTTAIVVRCKWNKYMGNDGMIPLSIAMPLLLEKELEAWHRAEVAETWENMRPYFLGRPHGSRSSLFVSQETGQAMKKIWNLLIHTGMYGPIHVGP